MNKENITDSLTEKQAEAFNNIVSSSVSESGTDSLSEPLKNKDEEFDIADFIVKHSTQYSVKKSKAPRIIAIVAVAVIIIGLCVVLLWYRVSSRIKIPFSVAGYQSRE